MSVAAPQREDHYDPHAHRLVLIHPSPEPALRSPPQREDQYGPGMTTAWALEVSRSDLADTALHELDVPEPGDGEAVLRADRVGLTANNVTYAVLGKSFRYWDFFPATDPGSGRVPLWGFCEVAASRADGVQVGRRLYGFLPMASHLVVRPDRADERGFHDGAAHRAGLPSPYNAYALTTATRRTTSEHEDLQVLYRPLFFTSFVLADFLVDGGAAGAQTVVLSSASSKTAYGARVPAAGAGVRTVGLTSPAKRRFTPRSAATTRSCRTTRCGASSGRPTAYVDCAGSTPLRQELHDHLGSALTLDLVVGCHHQDSSPAGSLSGPPVGVLRADQMRKRTGLGGRADDRFGRRGVFVPAVEQWVDVQVGSGRGDCARLARGAVRRSAPRTGHDALADLGLGG
jgi:hypothetical protein